MTDKNNSTEKLWKGQYFSFDALMASVIFILTLISLLSYWHSVRLTIEDQHGELVKEAFRISELLLSPGYPSDKQCADMNEIGLSISFSDKRLNQTKINDCFALSYDVLKTKMGTTDVNTIAIEIREAENEGLITFAGTVPQDSGVDVINSAKIRRIVSIYNDPGKQETAAYIDVFVYRTE